MLVVSTRSKKPLAMAVAIAATGSTTSFAQEGLVIEEVVVTAQKRSESTQDIGASVNAVTGDALEEFNAFSFEDVSKLTAGLTLTNSNPRQQTIAMRGVSVDPDTTASPTVDAYWNGLSVRPDVIFNQMFDVERLEVLRGPQGTLQGKTSPAGAITLVTRTPDMEVTEGQVQTSLNDNGGTNTQFGVSVPLIPGELSARIAGVYDEDELDGVKNITTGSDDSQRNKAGRVTLAWQPSDTFSAQLAMEYSEQNITAPEDVVYNGSDSSKIGNKYDRIALANGDQIYSKRNQMAALSLDWDMTDNLLLSSVTGFQKNFNSNQQDLDYANLYPGQSQWSIAETEMDQFSQELRLSSIEPAFWEYVVGTFYEKKTLTTDLHREIMPFGSMALTANNIPVNTEDFGVFVHNTFNFTDSTRAQVGARWSKYRKYYRYDYSVNGGDIQSAIPDDQDSISTEAFTGGVKLLHDLNDNVMVYTSIDRSFRPGAVAIDPALTVAEDLTYEDETSDSLEIGLKSTLWDGRLQLNAAAYYQQYENYISRATNVLVDSNLDGTGDTRATGVTFNGDAIVRGAEIDFTSLLTESWTLGGAVSYVDAKYDDAEVPCDTGDFGGSSAIATCSTSGRVSGEPNWSVSMNTEYVVPMDEFEMFTRAIYKYTGSSHSDYLGGGGSVGGYGVTDVFLGVRDHSYTWEVSAWAKNVFDKEAETSYTVNDLTWDGQDSGYRRVDLLQDRTVGITAKYFF